MINKQTKIRSQLIKFHQTRKQKPGICATLCQGYTEIWPILCACSKQPVTKSSSYI